MSKISKPIKIALGAAVALVVTGVLVFVAAFPGFGQYKALEYGFATLNIRAEENPFTLEPSEELFGAGGKGFQFMLPDKIGCSDMGGGQILFSDGTEDGSSVLLLDKLVYEPEDYDVVTDSGISAKNWEKFFRGLGRNIPENYYELLDAAYSLTMDDFNIHSRSGSMAFLNIAARKEGLICPDWSVYRFSSDNAVGFIFYTGCVGEDLEQMQFFVQLFPIDNLNEEHMAIVTSPDMKVIGQIISSFDLVEV